ncbi:hypothetical protein [Bartonella grahamii]|nr:hypothetical protein [Bartonella grahamii]
MERKEKGRFFTAIKKREEKGGEKEMARLLTGEQITEEARAAAKKFIE